MRFAEGITIDTPLGKPKSQETTQKLNPALDKWQEIKRSDIDLALSEQRREFKRRLYAMLGIAFIISVLLLFWAKLK